VSLDTIAILGVLTALSGTVLLAVGAQLQHRGVESTSHSDGPGGGLKLRQLAILVRNRLWLLGILLTGAAMVLNLISLRLAPLIVVQPLGVVALVITALLNARAHSYRLSWASISAIAVCVAGIGTFVTVGALTARNSVVSDADLGVILTVLSVAVVLILVAVVTLRRRFPAMINVLSAGLLSGFVVTLAKTVVTRVSVGEIGWLTFVGAVALVAAATASAYFVQSAYASGPVDLIVAGLTILDPLVAVTLGVLVLGEAARTPLWAVLAYGVSGAAAILGVFLLARNHPQAAEYEEEARLP
jgi:drug/metabolite transporter (DMT)-like permease